MMHSLRAFGYDLGMAIADLIDNSIFAGAKTVKIDYAWNEGKPWIRIIDDGCGMTEEGLFEAMRLGSRSPLEIRDIDDLGRFGLGLKTASFSQCRLLSVCTKTVFGQAATRFWDLDKISVSQSWLLGRMPPKDSQRLFEPLSDVRSGTAVLWQKIDSMTGSQQLGAHNPENLFLETFLSVKDYIEMVFHQFLEHGSRNFNIVIGAAQCEPWDPYLRANPFTQELSSEKYEDSRIVVIPYVLPHVSKRTEDENLRGSGPKGWNAQQGFYIYRNQRMIVSGGYLNFNLKPEEHFKLARIKVDIPNDMDHEWSIDVKKASARPPDRLRGELLRIAKATRQKAAEVYRIRTIIGRRHSPSAQMSDVWLKKTSGDKIVYKLNPDNLVIKRIIDEVHLEKSWLKKLFHVIETTVPHRLIIMDNLEHEDCHVNLPNEMNSPPKELFALCGELYREYRAGGKSHDEAVHFICSMDVFNTHPAYRAYLDDMKNHKGKRNGCF
jgi:hypothetical protein